MVKISFMNLTCGVAVQKGDIKSPSPTHKGTKPARRDSPGANREGGCAFEYYRARRWALYLSMLGRRNPFPKTQTRAAGLISSLALFFLIFSLRLASMMGSKPGRPQSRIWTIIIGGIAATIGLLLVSVVLQFSSLSGQESVDNMTNKMQATHSSFTVDVTNEPRYVNL